MAESVMESPISPMAPGLLPVPIEQIAAEQAQVRKDQVGITATVARGRTGYDAYHEDIVKLARNTADDNPTKLTLDEKNGIKSIPEIRTLLEESPDSDLTQIVVQEAEAKYLIVKKQTLSDRQTNMSFKAPNMKLPKCPDLSANGYKEGSRYYFWKKDTVRKISQYKCPSYVAVELMWDSMSPYLSRLTAAADTPEEIFTIMELRIPSKKVILQELETDVANGCGQLMPGFSDKELVKKCEKLCELIREMAVVEPRYDIAEDSTRSCMLSFGDSVTGGLHELNKLLDSWSEARNNNLAFRAVKLESWLEYIRQTTLRNEAVKTKNWRERKEAGKSFSKNSIVKKFEIASPKPENTFQRSRDSRTSGQKYLEYKGDQDGTQGKPQGFRDARSPSPGPRKLTFQKDNPKRYDNQGNPTTRPRSDKASNSDRRRDGNQPQRLCYACDSKDHGYLKCSILAGLRDGRIKNVPNGKCRFCFKNTNIGEHKYDTKKGCHIVAASKQQQEKHNNPNLRMDLACEHKRYSFSCGLCWNSTKNGKSPKTIPAIIYVKKFQVLGLAECSEEPKENLDQENSDSNSSGEMSPAVTMTSLVPMLFGNNQSPAQFIKTIRAECKENGEDHQIIVTTE